jgi:hypothetical protein
MWAIRELERIIRDNKTMALRCQAYGDPQKEIDVYYDMNKELEYTISVLKTIPQPGAVARASSETWSAAAKTLRYALAYNASPEKVAETFELNASTIYEHKLEEDK